jgi:hypothetical protein
MHESSTHVLHGKPSMFESLHAQFRQFVADRSGTRFQQRYRRRTERPGGIVRKSLVFALATLLVLIGLLLLVLPGPGLLVIVIGAGLFAEESLLIARLLDRIDLLLTRRVRRWRAARAARAARPSR